MISLLTWVWKRKLLFIMRLTFSICLFCVLQSFAIGSFSQNLRLSINQKKISVESALQLIEDQTDYYFMYSALTVDVKRTVDLEATNKLVPDILDDIFKNTDVSYKINGRLIALTKSGEELIAAQQISVSGKVTDSTGASLPGVSIVVKGTTNGTITDFDGKYTLANVQGDAVLVYSFVGMKTQEVRVSGKSVIDVKLEEDAIGIEEVVAIGYGTMKKSDLTGSVSSVSAKEFTNLPVTRFDQMLQGRAAGVDVKSIDGAPGSGTTIRIRGNRSINASNEPLYVIDGIIGEGNLSSINTNDIESINILKDASAIAIYGSRGSNGVVLVTTKKGKEGKDAINLSVTRGIQSIDKSRKPEMMNAKQFAEFENESRVASGLKILYTDEQIAAMGEGTDWIDEATRDAAYANYNISFSGGNNGLTYYLSGNIMEQEGIVLNSGYKRYQVRMNLDKVYNSWFKMGANFNVSRDRIDKTTVELGSNLGWPRNMFTLPPTMPVYKEDGSLESYNPIYYSGGGHVNTPVAQTLVELFTRSNELQGNMYAEFKILDGLKFKSTLGTVLYSNRYNYYEPSYMPLKIAQKSETGNASGQSEFSSYLLNENLLTYDKEIKDHHVNIVAGGTYQHRETEVLYASGTGLTDDILKYNNLSVTEQSRRGVNSDQNENTLVSFLGRANYDYKKKYFITATGRYDGASNFARNKKWGFFPSFALKWNVAEESFYKESNLSSFISNLSLRGSHGMSGNQGIANYQSLPSLSSTSNGYIFGQGNTTLAFTQGNLENKRLTWETTTQTDLGLEFGLLKGKINVTADYYHMTTKDLLLTVQIPSQTGYTSRLMNIGKTMSRGFDLQISANIFNNRDFSWRTDITMSTNDQEVLDLGPLVQVLLDHNNYGAYTNYLEVGVPLGANFGVEYVGPWQSQEEIDTELAKPAGQREYVSKNGYYKPGRPKYIDYNHDGQLSQAGDYHYLGTTNPTFFGGIGNSFRYKNLSLDFFIQYSAGNTMYNDLEFFIGSGYYLTNQLEYMTDRWTPTNTDTNIPSVDSRDNIPSTRVLHDASFIRLKSARVSYNLGNNLLKKYVKSCDIFVSGTNLFLFSKYNGFDPEVNKGGSSSTIRAKDDGTYPNARMIAVGVNLSF